MDQTGLKNFACDTNHASTKKSEITGNSKDLASTVGNVEITYKAGEVFEIPELLENILCGVSQIDVFVHERVSRAFYHTIRGSKVLQRKKFAACEDLVAEWERKTNRSVSNVRNRRGASFATREEGATAAMLSSVLVYHRLGFLQLQPFSSDIMIDYEGSLCFDFVEEQGQPMGWQGKCAVYTTGSWELIELGRTKGAMKVLFVGSLPRGDYKSLKGRDPMPAGATMGTLIGYLEEYRQQEAERVVEALRRKSKLRQRQDTGLNSGSRKQLRIAKDLLSVERVRGLRMI
jgi:hypothetical protein